uniref:Stromal cell-derived factor 2-like 1 n=1 Tax=Salarias fasciatus TaxID=181472 RepID=A0A672HPY6_SALFA
MSRCPRRLRRCYELREPEMEVMRSARGSVLPLLPLLLLVLGTGCDARDTELSYVTCGSLVKLLNTRHNVRLHSHDVKYGSGSGQQSVTGVENADDANSYWQIRGKPNRPCQRGVAIKCGQAVRITHMKTGRNLHTHHFSSPLSNNQEVSAFGEHGEGDDLDVWTVQCDACTGARRGRALQARAPDRLPERDCEQYGHPIRVMREVHCMTPPNQHNWWRAMEGVFIPAGQRSAAAARRL